MIRCLRLGLVALFALAAVGISSPSQAQTGSIYISILKAGWFVGASGGSGTLNFQGRRYPLAIGGLSAGLTFGASKAELTGQVYNIYRPSDIAGIYTAAGAGLAVAGGAKVAILRNSRGVELRLRGRQIGLEFNLDVSGIEIVLR